MPRPARDRLAQLWPELRDLLTGDVAARAAVRRAGLERDLARRETDELARVDEVIEHMRRTLTAALGEQAPVQLRLDELDLPERRQLDSDRAAWRSRLETLDGERDRDRAAVHPRYGGVRELAFPVAVLLVVPAEPA